MPMLEAKAAHHAVAAQESVVTQKRRILRIGHAAVPAAFDLIRQRAFQHQIVDVALDP
jgi:hypothetical protein